MLFTVDTHPRIASGEINVTFRSWKRARAKAGGRHRVGKLILEIDDVSQVPVDAIGDDDVRRAGFADKEALLRRAGAASADVVWRIAFHVVAPAAPLPAAEVATRLDRLDRAAAIGPWTRATLRLIGDQPGVVSTRLAEQLGRDRPSFKVDVRKLKKLGLTESLEVGYRLTTLGREVVDGGL